MALISDLVYMVWVEIRQIQTGMEVVVVDIMAVELVNDTALQVVEDQVL